MSGKPEDTGTAAGPQLPERYYVIKKLGAGSFGSVWLANDVESGMQVALKVCAMVTKGGHPVSRMLEEEARVQMMVKHPNIIAVHNHFIYKDNYVIVMQPAKGLDMWTRYFDISKKEKRLVDAVVAPLLSALATLHGCNIMHRDVKMENVLITERGHVMLSDFGLAVDLSRKRPVSAVGTVHAMAPELLLHYMGKSGQSSCTLRKDVPRAKREPYGVGVDIWSFGVLLSELLGNSLPTHGVRDAHQAAQALLKGHELVINSSYSAQAVDFLAACFEVQADRRVTAMQLYEHPWIMDNVSARRWMNLHPNKFIAAYKAETDGEMVDRGAEGSQVVEDKKEGASIRSSGASASSRISFSAISLTSHASLRPRLSPRRAELSGVSNGEVRGDLSFSSTQHALYMREPGDGAEDAAKIRPVVRRNSRRSRPVQSTSTGVASGIDTVTEKPTTGGSDGVAADKQGVLSKVFRALACGARPRAPTSRARVEPSTDGQVR